MGLMVPLRYEKEDMHGNVVFKDVVTRVRCKARPLAGERFALSCGFDQDSVYSPNRGDSEEAKAKAALTPPVVGLVRMDGSAPTRLSSFVTARPFSTSPPIP